MSNVDFEAFNAYLESTREDLFKSVPKLREADHIRALLDDEYAGILSQIATVSAGEVINTRSGELITSRIVPHDFPESTIQSRTGIEFTGAIACFDTLSRRDYLANRGTSVYFYEPCLVVFDQQRAEGTRSYVPLVRLERIDPV